MNRHETASGAVVCSVLAICFALCAWWSGTWPPESPGGTCALLSTLAQGCAAYHTWRLAGRWL